MIWRRTCSRSPPSPTRSGRGRWPDGKVTRLITDAGKPNGVQVSPDQKTLYVLAHDNGAHDFLAKGETSQKGLMACLAYDLSPDGTVSNRRVLVDWLPNDGGDGIDVARHCPVPGPSTARKPIP